MWEKIILNVLYTIGDSISWGAELENKEQERFSKVLSNKIDFVDCNNSSAGVSNDYIFRNTIRDISHWKETKQIWSEETGWINSDNIFVIVSWTSPTRFEWWNGAEYLQERLWVDYDQWGAPDINKSTEDRFVLHQTELIPSYIRTLNHVQSLSSFLTINEIPFYFFNAFFKYDLIDEPKNKIDKFGRETYQLCLTNLLNNTPKSFREINMYEFLENNKAKLLPRNHPDKNAHSLWAGFLYEEIKCLLKNT